MENKIITLRGTSGSGKTTLVKRLFPLYAKKEAVFVEKRKQPLYYVLTHENGSQLAVIGHYEIACGGCDTISGFDTIFNLVKEHVAFGHVLFEGVLLNDDFNRTKELGELDIVFLDTPLEVCLASVNARRQARGVVEPVNPKNTTNRYHRSQKYFKRFQKEAPLARVYSLNREDAFLKVREILGV